MSKRRLTKAKLRAYSIFESTTKRTEVKPKLESAILPQTPFIKPRLEKFYTKIESRRSEKAAIRERREKPRQIGNEWFTGKKTISMDEHKRRSEAAKKSWEKRKNKKMYRNTIGTGLSDHRKPISFTMFCYTLEYLDVADLDKIERKMHDEITKWMQKTYPKQRYSYANNFDEWSHGREIVRTDPNTVYDINKEDLGKWFFEAHKESRLDYENKGDVADVL